MSSSKKQPIDKDLEVDERKSTVLKTVVDTYVDTSNPVASRVVGQRSGLEVSSATIRNDMQVLEGAGYLTHPHTSSGKIPTDRGYRYFVDHFVDESDEQIESQVKESIQKAAQLEQIGEWELLLDKTAHLVSSLTDHTAVIIRNVSNASSSDVKVAGVANIAKNSSGQIESNEMTVALLTLLEQHMVIIDLVRDSLQTSSIARIGSENSRDEMNMHSMVLTPFESDGDKGAIGVIGPTRMDYRKVFACLDAASASIAELMEE